MNTSEICLVHESKHQNHSVVAFLILTRIESWALGLCTTLLGLRSARPGCRPWLCLLLAV